MQEESQRNEEDNPTAEDESKKAEVPAEEKKPVAVDTGKRVVLESLPKEAKTIRRQKERPEGSQRRSESKPPERKPLKAQDEKPFVKKAKESITQSASEVAPEQAMKEKPMATPKAAPIQIERPEPTEWDESGDFASMLDESMASLSEKPVEVGDRVKGRVIHIGSDHAFLSLGPKSEAAIDLSELRSPEGQITVKMGDTIEAYVLSTKDGIVLSKQISGKAHDTAFLDEAFRAQIPVSGKVSAQNKGGFDVQVLGTKAFCPIGQIDDHFVEDASTFVGKTFSFLVKQISEQGRNVVLSRRAILEREQNQKALEQLKNLEEGQTLLAVITRVADFGAFADIGGIVGLIPRSELHHGHFSRPSDVISVGDRVSVMVMQIEPNLEKPSRSRLSLSIKKAQPDPYLTHWNKIKPGETLEGKVVRLENYGAFVELFPGLDGLIHISELSENKVRHPEEVLQVGAPVTVRVLEVNPTERRVSLSLREAVEKKSSTGSAELHRGDKVSGVVSRIERYGVFLKLKEGPTGLIPHSETGLPHGADLHKAFPIGSQVEALVIEVDGANRIRLSIVARESFEEKESYQKFQTSQSKDAKFGSLGDLLKHKKS